MPIIACYLFNLPLWSAARAQGHLGSVHMSESLICLSIPQCGLYSVHRKIWTCISKREGEIKYSIVYIFAPIDLFQSLVPIKTPAWGLSFLALDCLVLFCRVLSPRSTLEGKKGRNGEKGKKPWPWYTPCHQSPHVARHLSTTPYSIKPGAESWGAMQLA